jgi:hypothetical protein
MRRLGLAGLVFNVLKRTTITGTTTEKWVFIMNVVQSGRSWFYEEIRRVFGDAAPRFLAALTGTTQPT